MRSSCAMLYGEMPLSAGFQTLGRKDPFAAHQWLVEAGVLDELTRRLRARLTGVLSVGEARLPQELAARALKVAAARAGYFEAREAPELLEWLEGLTLPDIERRWFMGFDERLAASLRSFPLDDPTCEEIAVRSVTRAIVRLERYDPERGSLFEFTLGIARRRARDLLARRPAMRRELELDRISAAGSSLGEVDARDLAGWVFAALRACTHAERFVFRARVRGADYEAIAARLGYGVPSTHNVMHRTRALLGRRLERGSEWR